MRTMRGLVSARRMRNLENDLGPLVSCALNWRSAISLRATGRRQSRSSTSSSLLLLGKVTVGRRVTRRAADGPEDLLAEDVLVELLGIDGDELGHGLGEVLGVLEVLHDGHLDVCEREREGERDEEGGSGGRRGQCAARAGRSEARGQQRRTERLSVTLCGEAHDAEDAGLDLGHLEVRLGLGEEVDGAQEAVAASGACRWVSAASSSR